MWFEYDCYQPGVLAVYPSGGNISLWQGTSVAGLTPVPQYYTTPMDPRWTDINFVMEPWGPNPEPNTLYNTKGVDFNLTQPGTYYLRLSGPPSVYTNQVEFHLRPINDNFENPIDLPTVSYSGTTAQLQDYSYSYSYTSEGATLQAGEPANPMGPATVWYRWQAPGNGAFSVGATLTAQTFDQDPEALFYPCQIDMYQGNSLTELQTVPSSYTNSPFSVDTTASPTNTSWDTAWPLNGSSVTVTEPNGGSGTWWFTYVSPATGTITVDAGGVWSVESGSRLQDAVLIGEADGYGDSGPGIFSAVKGETYHILIPGGDQTFALFPSGSYNITAQAGQTLLHPPQRNRFQAYDHWIIRQPARQRQSGQCLCHNADPQPLRQRRKVVHQRKRVFGRRQQRTRRKHYGGRRHRLQPHGLVCRNPAFQRENDHGHRGYRLQQRLHRNQWRSTVHGGVDPHSNSHLRCRGGADVLHPGFVRGGFAVRALHHAK